MEWCLRLTWKHDSGDGWSSPDADNAFTGCGYGDAYAGSFAGGTAGGSGADEAGARLDGAG
jgi:hypothetical protein